MTKPDQIADLVAFAEREFGRPLRWLEPGSSDTRENAVRTVALLQPQGIEQVVLVTHGYHMRRALRNFERAAQSAGWSASFVAAPVGRTPRTPARTAGSRPLFAFSSGTK